MPKTLDIEKIKRKYKPSYSDYGKAVLVNVLTVNSGEQLITQEDLNKIADKAYKAVGYEGDTPGKFYAPILSDFILCNEAAGIHAAVTLQQLESVKNTLCSSNELLIILQDLYNQTDNKKQLLEVLKNHISSNNSSNSLKCITDCLNQLNVVIAFPYIYTTVWNRFVDILSDELGYGKLQYTYKVDSLIASITKWVNQSLSTLDDYLILKEINPGQIQSVKSSLTQTSNILNEILKYDLEDNSLDALIDTVDLILDEPITTLTSSFGVRLMTIASEESKLFSYQLKIKYGIE